MPVPRCHDCGANLEELAMPNGGRVHVNAVPGLLLVSEDGPHRGLEPRKLTTVRGTLLHFEDARKAQEAGRPVVRVWTRHECPRAGVRQDPAPAEKPAEPAAPEQPRLF